MGSEMCIRDRNCPPDFISPSGPLSRHRERGWGERADTPVATLGAILCAVRIDFGLPSKINPYPAQPATGVLGQRPKRVLVPFTRVKGTPRRRAVLTKPSKRLAPPKAHAVYVMSIRRKARPRLATLLPFCGLTGRHIFTIMELENTPERSI